MDKRSILRLVTLNAIINGDFAADSDWTKGTDWSISGGLATHINGALSDLEEIVGTLPGIGRTAYITFDVTGRTAGGVTPKAGTQAGSQEVADGTFTQAIVVAGDGVLRFEASADFAGSIDNVKVRFAAEGDSNNPLDGDKVKAGAINDVTIVNTGTNKAHVAWKQGGFAQATEESMDFSGGDSYTMEGRQFDNFSALAAAVDAEVNIQVIVNGTSGV